MTPAERFQSFRLIFDFKCLDCLNQNQIKCMLSDLFNLEGDFINSKNIDCNYRFLGCNLQIFIDYSNISKPKTIREIYDGIVMLQENLS